MTTLREYRQAFARMLGGYEERGAVSASADRTTSATGSASGLIEARWPVQRQRLDSDLYEGAMLYRTGENASPTLVAADRVRQVGFEGYVPAEGRFVPDTDWANPPVAGEHYEIHMHGFDPFGEVTNLLNEALRALMLVVDVAFTPAVDAKGAYVPPLDDDGHTLGRWLQYPHQILALRGTAQPGPMYAINGNSGRAALRGAAWTDGAQLYLSPVGAALGTATPLWAQVLKPAYEHCRASGGAYGAQAGLTAGVETDEAYPAAAWVAAAAIGLAVERGGRKVDEQQAAAAKLAFYRESVLYWQSITPEITYAPLERVG